MQLCTCVLCVTSMRMAPLPVPVHATHLCATRLLSPQVHALDTCSRTKAACGEGDLNSELTWPRVSTRHSTQASPSLSADKCGCSGVRMCIEGFVYGSVTCTAHSSCPSAMFDVHQRLSLTAACRLQPANKHLRLRFLCCTMTGNFGHAWPLISSMCMHVEGAAIEFRCRGKMG